MSDPFHPPLKLVGPGLFITATDTGVGKTAITCALAKTLQNTGKSVGICKPLASGAKRQGAAMISEDAQVLQRFADGTPSLEAVCPVVFEPPVAPAAAAAMLGQHVDWSAIARTLRRQENDHDLLLVEGVGGLLVPLDDVDPSPTVLDLILAVGFPVVVVARGGLGTLNHTAMTLRLLQQTGAKVAGVVLNDAAAESTTNDPSRESNAMWITRMTGAAVLASVPWCEDLSTQLERGAIPQAMLTAMSQTDWRDHLS